MVASARALIKLPPLQALQALQALQDVHNEAGGGKCFP
jgi:hypothetical protein